MNEKLLARYASLNNFTELSRSFGLDPAAMVRDAGLDPAGLSLQDRWAPAIAIANLLERAAAASGREDFGIRLAELRRFSNLGPLSMVIREEPDVRSALRISRGISTCTTRRCTFGSPSSRASQQSGSNSIYRFSRDASPPSWPSECSTG